MSDWIDIAALAKILAIGLVGGAGLAAVFAFGLVGLTAHQEARTAGGGSPVALAGAGFAFPSGTCRCSARRLLMLSA